MKKDSAQSDLQVLRKMSEMSAYSGYDGKTSGCYQKQIWKNLHLSYSSISNVNEYLWVCVLLDLSAVAFFPIKNNG